MIPVVELVNSFKDKRILVFGDMMLDEYLWGNTSRISPEAPIPVVNIKNKSLSLGGAGNVAKNITSLGGVVYLGCVIGDDLHADMIKHELNSMSAIIPSGLVVIPGRSTTTKTRVVSQNQQLVRLDVENTEDILSKYELILSKWIDKTIRQVDVCIISDYNKGTVTQKLCKKIITSAIRNKRLVVVDPKGKNYSKYYGATIITPNKNEIEIATGLEVNNEKQLRRAVNALWHKLPGTHICVTRGREGITIFSPGFSRVTFPAKDKQVYDVTGAGDTVVSVVALSLACKSTIKDACYLANFAGGVAVQKFGSIAIRPDELLIALHDSNF